MLVDISSVDEMKQQEQEGQRVKGFTCRVLPEIIRQLVVLRPQLQQLGLHKDTHTHTHTPVLIYDRLYLETA